MRYTGIIDTLLAYCICICFPMYKFVNIIVNASFNLFILNSILFRWESHVIDDHFNCPRGMTLPTEVIDSCA